MDTLIHVWKGSQVQYQAELARVTAAGFATLLSTPWYLNRISYGQDWVNIYKADPCNFTGVCVCVCVCVCVKAEQFVQFCGVLLCN